MRLTTKSEYSLLALIYIARHQGDGYVKIDEICEKYDIPRKYLEQLLTTLKRSRLIVTRRGAEGGYRLAQPVTEIDVAQIVRLMDGPLAPSDSVSKYFYAHTPLEQEPKILKVLQEIRDFISKKLEKLTLKDLT